MLRRLDFAVAGLALSALAAIDAGPMAQGSELVANPILLHELPPPGWLAGHRDEWKQQRAVYRSACETPEVVAEIHFLNRIIGHDEFLLKTADDVNQSDPEAARQAEIARDMAGTLRDDISAADGLTAQLQALPKCSAVTATPPADVAAPTPAAATPVVAAPNVATEPLVIRFDDRMPALAPSGIQAFDEAIEAIGAGKTPQLTIDGCGAGADFANGSTCARRRVTLLHMLAAKGVRDPKRLFANPASTDATK